MIVLDDPDESLTDPNFVPCRDERCRNPGVHREHRIKRGRGKPSKHCPGCGALIVRKPGERAYCARACGWRGYFVKSNQVKEKKSA